MDDERLPVSKVAHMTRADHLEPTAPLALAAASRHVPQPQGEKDIVRRGMNALFACILAAHWRHYTKLRASKALQPKRNPVLNWDGVFALCSIRLFGFQCQVDSLL